MKRTAFCIVKSTGTDKLSYGTADQCLCFRYSDSTIPLLSVVYISEISICGSTAQFVLDVVGNPKDRFSHDLAHFILRHYYF